MCCEWQSVHHWGKLSIPSWSVCYFTPTVIVFFQSCWCEHRETSPTPPWCLYQVVRSWLWRYGTLLQTLRGWPRRSCYQLLHQMYVFYFFALTTLRRRIAFLERCSWRLHETETSHDLGTRQWSRGFEAKGQGWRQGCRRRGFCFASISLPRKSAQGTQTVAKVSYIVLVTTCCLFSKLVPENPLIPLRSPI